MSFWHAPAGDRALSSSEGVLVSVSIKVDARHLESLLEALAAIEFPINPQIYHDAGLVYTYPDGHESVEPVTLVEFPAFETHLDEVRRALAAYGFDPEAVQVLGMLDEIQEAYAPEPVPPGAPYRSLCRVKHRAAAAAC